MPKKITAFLLCVLLLLGVLPAGALGAPSVELEPVETGPVVNPLYADLLSPEELAALAERQDLPDPATLLDGEYVATREEAAALLRTGLRAREGAIAVNIELTTEQYNSWGATLLADLWTMALLVTADGQEGDYLKWNWIGYSSGYNGSVSLGIYRLTCTYNVSYTGTTSAQEAETVAAADTVLAGFGFTDQTSAYDKIRAIYEWVAENVSYTAPENVDDLFKHTAYSAMIDQDAVCQGYSLLLYYMLWTSGVPCRIVTGLGNGGGHAWNLVWLRGDWYSLDATWASTTGDLDDFFLRGRDSDFYGSGDGNSHAAPDDPNHPEFSVLYQELVGASSADDYGQRRDNDAGECVIHDSAEAHYVTPGGDTCSFCPDCGQSITHPLWQGNDDLVLTLSSTSVYQDEKMEVTAASEGAEFFIYVTLAASIVGEVPQLGEVLASSGPTTLTTLYFMPMTAGLFCSAVYSYIGRWAYGVGFQFFEVLPAAQYTEGDWTYRVAGGEAAVLAYGGGGEIVIIPDTLGGAPVTAIGQEAFRDNTDLGVLAIPAGVTQIGKDALSGCAGLESLHFAGTAAQWEAMTVGEGNDPLLGASVYAHGGTATAFPLAVMDPEGSCAALVWCGAEETVTVYAARYDEDGRFLGCAPTALTPGTFNLVEAALDGAARIRLFALDEDVAPVCGEMVSPELPT